MIIVALLVVIDQLTKVIMDLWLPTLASGEYTLIDGVFSFAYVRNDGAAWGMFSGQKFVLIGVTFAAIVVILVLMFRGKIKGVLYNTAAVLILAGGIGNLIDRVFRGYVIDFLRALFIDFPVFNFADCLITIGAIILVIRLIMDVVRDRRNDKNKVSEPPEPEGGSEEQ